MIHDLRALIFNSHKTKLCLLPTVFILVQGALVYSVCYTPLPFWLEVCANLILDFVNKISHA